MFHTNTLIVQVQIMSTFEHRDALFGSDTLPFDADKTVFVWSGRGDPFTNDEIGSRMMRFLILVADWEGDNLAESLFSGINIRLVDVLHKGDGEFSAMHANSKLTKSRKV